MLLGTALFSQRDPDLAQRQIRDKNHLAKAFHKHKNRIVKISPDARDLLTKMLHHDPRKRIGAREALRHPFVLKSYDPKDYSLQGRKKWQHKRQDDQTEEQIVAASIDRDNPIEGYSLATVASLYGKKAHPFKLPGGADNSVRVGGGSGAGAVDVDHTGSSAAPLTPPPPSSEEEVDRVEKLLVLKGRSSVVADYPTGENTLGGAAVALDLKNVKQIEDRIKAKEDREREERFTSLLAEAADEEARRRGPRAEQIAQLESGWRDDGRWAGWRDTEEDLPEAQLGPKPSVHTHRRQFVAGDEPPSVHTHRRQFVAGDEPGATSTPAYAVTK